MKEIRILWTYNEEQQIWAASGKINSNRGRDRPRIMGMDISKSGLRQIQLKYSEGLGIKIELNR